MPKVDRKNPKRAQSSESQYSLMEFMREFPDDDACLEWLWLNRVSDDGKHASCERCEEVREFKRYKTGQRRQSWTCTACGHHLHPTAGTIFHGSATSLHLWFYAIHLMTSTRCGLSAKQLEREIGVTYKTAWRMLNLIRNSLMTPDRKPLSGEVELDETGYGGKPRASVTRKGRAAARAHADAKPTVFGMVERGGRIKATIVPHRAHPMMSRMIYENVLPESMIFTDEWPAYGRLHRRYVSHSRIRHSERVYVSGDVHTQTIEGFFGLLKNGIRGTHHAVSRKWLQSYLDEFAWRYNHRHDSQAMFRTLLLRAARS